MFAQHPDNFTTITETDTFEPRSDSEERQATAVASTETHVPAAPDSSPTDGRQQTAQRHREVFSRDRTHQTTSSRLKEPLLAELEMIGWARFPKTQVHGLGPHFHMTYEICCIVDGGVTWWVGDDAFEVKRGDIFFTRPYEWHGGVEEVMHPCELYWLQLCPDSMTAPLCQALDADGSRCFAVSDAASLFARLFQEHREPTVFSEIATRAALHSLLVAIVRARARQQSERVLSPVVRHALDWMLSRLKEPFAIQEVAVAVGLPSSRFHERFLLEVGQTPAEWRIRQRIAAARQLLRDTEQPITEIAFQLGFASSQYFATAFKKYTGRTPSEYRNGRF